MKCPMRRFTFASDVNRLFSLSPVLLLLLTACASTAIDMAEPRRIVGTENGVRVDAQVTGDVVAPGAQIPVTYEITNQRSTAIAVAELIPQTTYDAETHTFTVQIGSEVPGNETLPRLVEIAPGEKKTFSVIARLTGIFPSRGVDPREASRPAEFRLKINFLADTQPFRRLIGIKENAVADAKLADELFPLWLERNEAVYTNSIPLRWVGNGARRGPSPAERRGVSGW
jgi:hypothetical protein